MLTVRVCRPVVCVLALALTASLGLSAGWGGAEPKGLTLRYHQTEGDQAAYDFAATATMKLTIEPDMPGSRIDASIQMKCLAEFQGSTPEGFTQVQGQILSGGMKVKTETVEHTEPITGVAVNYQVSPRGEIKQRDLLSGESPTMPHLYFTFGPEAAFLLGGDVQFPSGPVKVGDTWKGTIRMPSWREDEELIARFESKALGLEQFRGRPCLKIKTTTKAFFTQTIPFSAGGPEVKAKIRVVSVATWRFDHERGLVMWAEGYNKTTTTAAATGPDGTRFEVTMSGITNMRTSLTKFNDEEIPAK